MRNLVDEKRLAELQEFYRDPKNQNVILLGDTFNVMAETLSLALKVVPAAYALCKAVEERNAGVVTDGTDILMALMKLEPLLVPFAPFSQENGNVEEK